MKVLLAWEERAYGGGGGGGRGHGAIPEVGRAGEGLGSRSCVRIPKMVCPMDGRLLGHSPLWGVGGWIQTRGLRGQW